VTAGICAIFAAVSVGKRVRMEGQKTQISAIFAVTATGTPRLMAVTAAGFPNHFTYKL
jgi:hypothetical protein